MHIFKNLKQKDYLRVENFLERNTFKWKVGQKNIRFEDTISNIIIEVGTTTAPLKCVSLSTAQSDFRSPD